MYYLKFQQESQEIFLNTHKKIPDRMGLPGILPFVRGRGFRRLIAIKDH